MTDSGQWAELSDWVWVPWQICGCWEYLCVERKCCAQGGRVHDSFVTSPLCINRKRAKLDPFVFKWNYFQWTHTDLHDSGASARALSCANLLQQILCVTHQPTLNSTWASNRATTGAVAALHPLTLDRIRPSCLACRTILMNPGRWLLVSDTKPCSFSFSSSAKHTHTLHKFHKFRGHMLISGDPLTITITTIAWTSL